MTFNNLPDLPPIQPRHFASPESLTPAEREANIRDYHKLKSFQEKHANSKQKISCNSKALKMIETRIGHVTVKGLVYDELTLKYFANKGSPTARSICRAQKHVENVYRKIQEHAPVESIISELAVGYREEQHPVIGDLLIRTDLKIIVENQLRKLPKLKKSQLDLDTRVCYGVLMTDLQEKAAFLETCVQKYPDEITFRVFLCHTLLLLNSNKLIEEADSALAKSPDSCLLLSIKAIFCNANKMFREAFDTCLKVLQVAPYDYPCLPEMYYFAAAGLHRLGIPSSEKYFKWGQQAEKERLPFLDPVCSSLKESLELVFQSLRPGEALIKAQYQFKRNGAKEMTELLNVFRVNVIRHYREEVMKLKQGLKMKSRVEPRVRRRKLVPLENIQFMSLNEMLTKKSGGSNLGMKCFVVEEAIIARSSVRLVAEDEKGEFFRVFIKNGNEEFAKKFFFTGKISLLNPYIWRDDDDDRVEVWIGGEDCVVFEGDLELKRCRFCWKKGASKKCGECKKCFYCSKECQEMDWLILKHEYVCEK